MRIVVIASLLVLAAGCGGGNGRQATDAKLKATYPLCSDLWVAGGRIPDDYSGCLRDDDLLEAANVTECVDGSKLFVHDDKFWTSSTGKVVGPVDVVNTAEYQAADRACAGG